jgi:protein TonB
MVFAVALHALVLVLPMSILIGRESDLTERDITFLIEALLGQEEPAEAPEPSRVEEPAEAPEPAAEPLRVEEPLPVAESTEPEPAQPEPPAPAEHPLELVADSATAAAGKPVKMPAEPVTSTEAQEILQKLECENKNIMELEKPPVSGQARSYLDRLRAKIAASAFFPHEARVENAHGKVIVQVKILRNGALDGVSFVKCSGFRCLDNAARLAVERAAPFDSLDKLVDMEYIRVNVPFRY